MEGSRPHPGSFRDPSGRLFFSDGVLHRQVNLSYREDYDRLEGSGLLGELLRDGLLVPHEEVAGPALDPETAYRVLRPRPLPFVSYPYEWCFGQLKAAALATLALQARALERGMSLKDASAYNIQFLEGRPVLIDTLSFERREEDRPWVAYRQFCQHFLAPLALMSRRDVRLGRLLCLHLDGVPLDLAAKLLPWRSRLRLPLLVHIHLHARGQRRYERRAVDPSRMRMSRSALLGLVDSLASAVSALTWEPGGTPWAGYYGETNYPPDALAEKERVVAAALERARPRTVLDLGANTGRFSRIASGRGIFTLATDLDPGAVEICYREGVRGRDRRLLPLVVDLANPSPAIGWANAERDSFFDRARADVVLALALVHHLAIANNVPLPRIAGLLADAGPRLVVEFVPKTDSQAQRLLAGRRDVFADYTQGSFERAFEERFRIVAAERIRASERTVYVMERRTRSDA